ncbi:MAG: 3'-5' exonuclease, partial [Limnobacter sp.]|nr:3'-5' exonuclease [Limnobacter sp.]
MPQASRPNSLGWQGYVKKRLGRVFDFSQPDDSRWVVLDVESSGLNPKSDRLISIATSAIRFTKDRKPYQSLTDTFEVIIKQPAKVIEKIDRDNILIHGIGLGDQQHGVPAPVALDAFLAYVGRSPMIAFHSWFDEILINKALRKVLGNVTHKHWLDLEHLAAVLHQENHQLPLDVWMQRYDIHCAARHQAAA